MGRRTDTREVSGALAARCCILVACILSRGSLVAGTLLTDAIDTRKPPSTQRCLATARRELNVGAMPQACQEDMLQFYCQKVRDLGSKRYLETFRHECNESAGEDMPPDMQHVPYEPAKIGYVILAHQFPENVKRLVMRLFEPGETTFALHIDTKNAGMLEDIRQWVEAEQMGGVVQVLSAFNVVRGGAAMLRAELLGIRALLNASVAWDFCVLLSEQDYPLRSHRVLAEYLWVHRGTNFVSVDEGECERDVSYQCVNLVVSLSGGAQYPKIPGMRYGSGSQWFAITRALASKVAADFEKPGTVIGAIYRDLTAVKQPDESFFQAIILNTAFCSEHIDYTLHWTDKDSLKEVRSETSAYSILSPGVLGGGADYFKLAEVRQQSLWAFFARKFDGGARSVQLRNGLDASAAESARVRWAALRAPATGRVLEVLASSLVSEDLEQVWRLDRNKDGLFAPQALRLHLRSGRVLHVREKMAMPAAAHPILAVRVGCSFNRTELVFDGDVSLVSSSASGEHACDSLWAVVHWRMSRRPVSRELVLVWVDPKGTPMQHAPLTVSEQSVLLWHRYTATIPLPKGRWSLQIFTPEHDLLLRRTFYAYGHPRDIPWAAVHEHFELRRDAPA